MKNVSVLMAVYRPNRIWLTEQLASIDEQTLPEVELLIRDDCPDEPVGDAFFRSHLSRVPFRYMRNASSLGPAQTFGALIAEAEGRCVAFCDQDDIWEREKLSVLWEQIGQPGVTGAYCGMSVIDADGAHVADDVREVRTGDYFLSGEQLAPRLFVKNCIYGNCLLLPAEIAQASLPIPSGFGHDHWTSLWAASQGALRFVDQPLVRYRLHGGNVSNSFSAIQTRRDYLRCRVDALSERCGCWERFSFDPALQSQISEIDQWTQARRRWLNRDFRALPALVRGRKYSPRAFAAELVLPFLPGWVVRRLFQTVNRCLSGQ